jgi:hypothetical protein
MFEPDKEILLLKKQAGVNYRDCGNALGMHPNTITQRVCGFIRWQSGERERLVKYLQAQIAEREQTTANEKRE